MARKGEQKQIASLGKSKHTAGRAEKALAKLAEPEAKLVQQLHSLDRAAKEELDGACGRAGLGDVRARLLVDLQGLAASAETARRMFEPDVSAGDGYSPRTLLAQYLIATVRDAGLDPSDSDIKRQLGDAVALALEAAGEGGADAHRMIREEISRGGDN
jgi:hypothetical protein